MHALPHILEKRTAYTCLCVLYSSFNVQKYKKCGNKSRSFYFFDYL